MTNELLQAYQATNYKVFEPPFCIKIGEQNTALNLLLEKYQAKDYTYISAYNPYSKQLSELENEERQRQLAIDLKDFKVFNGEGCGKDTTWPCEPSFLVIGISKAKAIELGNKYEQNAIVCGRIDSDPELVVLQKIHDTPPLLTETREQRKQRWEVELNAESDTELINRINEEVGKQGWGTARADYLFCLREEIKRRNFDTSILFETFNN